ncbi:DUF402 domain-containing protein [Lacicoccus qingdaonensis]|uniref:DUF402 domain-containing protein n=1 Tax=Lacicoccus qingdaonensis TaxID=576118 RepID=A0A1G9IST2_9BACL|nr:DUF402 domain-containing protein [Salinicoccus qingdaonensis]SDL28348.1 Protein of unknown function [Salinicoccus qingdaonensis]
MNHQKIIERKIKYNGEVIEHPCFPLKVLDDELAILYHKITTSFEMPIGNSLLHIPKGSYTVAFYWHYKSYNVYVFRNSKHKVIGLYINIVKETEINTTAVTFKDLIIDIAIRPDGEYAVLDQDELTEPLNQFENGTVNVVLNQLIDSILDIKYFTIRESEKVLRQNRGV